MRGLFYVPENTMKKIILSGDIGYSVTPDRVERELDEANGQDLDVYLAGPGGYVSDGIEVFNLFRDYKRKHPAAQMMLTIRGLAASMDTYIAVNPAWDLIAAEDNVPFMIHNVWGGAVGDYREMRKTAEIFEGLTGIIARAYAERTGKSLKKIREMMDEETWFFGEELLENGFVDEIIKTEKPADRAEKIAEAKAEFSILAEKMALVKTDMQKVAALIKPVASHPAADNSAGKNTQEGKPMTLQELLSQNPAAKIEYDAEMSAKYEAGKIAGRESLQATIKTAAKYLGVDGAYPAPIKSLAVDVLNGTKTAEALETTVAAFDALRESQNSKNAQGEQPPATPGQQENPPVPDDDMTAQLKRDKAAVGLVEV